MTLSNAHRCITHKEVVTWLQGLFVKLYKTRPDVIMKSFSSHFRFIPENPRFNVERTEYERHAVSQAKGALMKDTIQLH